MKKNAIIVSALFMLSCNQPKKIDTKAEGEKLMQLSKEWSQVASTKDIEKTLSYWADNAVLISAGQLPLNGKAAIRQMITESFKIPGFRISWQPRTVEISESGDMAYMMEDSQVSYSDSTGKSTTITNNAVSIWHKQKNGSWKNVVDISTPVPSSNE